jgi:hypothetical protein
MLQRSVERLVDKTYGILIRIGVIFLFVGIQGSSRSATLAVRKTAKVSSDLVMRNTRISRMHSLLRSLNVLRLAVFGLLAAYSYLSCFSTMKVLETLTSSWRVCSGALM